MFLKERTHSQHLMLVGREFQKRVVDTEKDLPL